MTGARHPDHLGDVHGAGAAALAEPAADPTPGPRGDSRARLAEELRPDRGGQGHRSGVHEGEIFGLIGPDGAGKTTTFQILAGIMEATSGVVEVFGKPARESRSAVGYLTQTFSLYPDLSVNENIRYVGDLRHVPPKEIAARRRPLSADVRHAPLQGPAGRTAERRHEAEAVAGVRAGGATARAAARRADHGRRSGLAARILGRAGASGRGRPDHRSGHALSRRSRALPPGWR